MSTGMQNIFIGRQPIYDRSMHVQGYELLFRHRDAGDANIIDGNSATSQVILNAFTVLGLDRVCNLPAYINVTSDFVVSHAELPFPVDRVGAQNGPVDTLRQAYLEAVAWSEEVARLFQDTG